MTEPEPDVAAEAAAGPTEWGESTGVGPWEGPPPDDPRYDPALLRDGDARNVVDAYRYWTRAAIVADIDRRRHPLHIAIENFGNDANIGAVVRTANAFAVDTVHIVGRRRWNRRGAMVTDRYQRLRHHDTTAELLTFAADAGLTVVAVDNVPGAIRLEHTALPRDCLLIFGQEGPGITDDARAGAAVTVSIAQFGSTRSINAAVAAGPIQPRPQGTRYEGKHRGRAAARVHAGGDPVGQFAMGRDILGAIGHARRLHVR
jgi:tRNA(Leu) C34 or U34 (ribose-2'-O)-methylase TrmL